MLDGVGIGHMPDADGYGDRGADTLGGVYAHMRAIGGAKGTPFALPNLEAMGLGDIEGVTGPAPRPDPTACRCRMAELSKGKDTTTGHWELMGLVTGRPFPTYPDGFPEGLMRGFEAAIGRKALGNKAASGTGIIEELGPEHMETGSPIVYTSADSVFQVAAHEAVIPPEELLAICVKARDLLVGEHAVARVIARPFAGAPGTFRRTGGRHDLSLPPHGATVLDRAKEAGHEVRGIGKIGEIFAMRGLTSSVPTKGNAEGVRALLETLREPFSGIAFLNLVDFDMLYGHRNDPSGFAGALAEFDARLPEVFGRLGGGDMLVVTADHGCDPCFPGTDHTREYVPALFHSEDRRRLSDAHLKAVGGHGPCVRAGMPSGAPGGAAGLGNWGTVNSFSFVGGLVSAWLGL
ncbi:MAG: phosphopentomutase [Oscillospiraceae bacterium]|nr:phosphopentomutase [Oscillospiraceae bacterium]